MEPTPAVSRRSSSDDEMSLKTAAALGSLASPGTNSPTKRKSPPPLDLSQLPPLSQPSPATNTLLFTNLTQPDVFRPENLGTIRDLISQTSAIHTWSPLRSFRRIVVSFFSAEAAIAVRQIWDGEAIMGERVRVFFGTATPVEARDEHLALPDAGKLFFISPPPSPPHDWEMRLEDAPNRMVHAEDLADALALLHKRRNNSIPLESPVSPIDTASGPTFGTRSRSSTLIYIPDEKNSPDLPAISVEDMTEDDVNLDAVDEAPRTTTHTARPPVELMQM